ncbi:hypothetical protein OAU50_00775 [Planctomycetota bacterium]|nr:hypothetical protein [Planctomycetota bacterium]
MYRQILAAMVLALSLAACGGGATNAPATGTNNASSGGCAPSGNTGDGKKDEPKKKPADPTAWKKVGHTPPSAWEKLNKDATTEIETQLTQKLKGSKFVACSGSEKPPHPSSGTEAEWTAWVESVNIGTLYFVADEKDAAAVLKTNGAKLVEKLGASVSGNASSATVKSGRVLVQAKATKYGTFVLVGVATANDASGKLEAWAKSIKE